MSPLPTWFATLVVFVRVLIDRRPTSQRCVLTRVVLIVAATMAKTSTYTVAPGDNVGFTVNAALSHPGPLSVWMSKAPDGTAANAYDGSGDWFKVYEL